MPYKQRQITLHVTWRDTILLAPAGHSLKAIGAMTSTNKIELTQDEIEHMDRLLIEEPKRYIEYAINDTRVALEYYLRFMQDFETLFLPTKSPGSLSISYNLPHFFSGLRATSLSKKSNKSGNSPIGSFT